MKPVTGARAAARECREALGGTGLVLLHGLKDLLQSHYKLELAPVATEFLTGSRAEISTDEGILYYDRGLDQHPEELLEVLAHEYGHLVLHHKYLSGDVKDLIHGSAFLDSSGAALARYSPRSSEEAQAAAFAAEFVCPSKLLFQVWGSESDVTLGALQERFLATPALIQCQLAEGLGNYLSDPSAEQASPNRSLTREQSEAAERMGSPVIVDAGPGTGKTRTLVARVRFLLEKHGARPENVLVLTFSNEACDELNDRLRGEIGEELSSAVAVKTFHGLGVTILDHFGHLLGIDGDFTIIDEATQREIVNRVLGEVDCETILNLSDPDRTAQEVADAITALKDRLCDPAELDRQIQQWSPPPSVGERNDATALQRVFAEYEVSKQRSRQFDFADLILLPCKLLSENAEVVRALREEFKWVLVDEYQDVSRGVGIFLRQLCGDQNPPWVVGDPRQTIYRFRGATPENLLQFAQDFPGAQSYQLNANYRSAPQIVENANYLAGLMEGTPHVEWRCSGTEVGLGSQPIVLARANSDASEYAGILGVVRAWIAEGVPPEEIAVVARRNIDVRRIAIALRENAIEACTSGILTAEGAAGDLACVLAVLDHRPAIARVAYALWRSKTDVGKLNEAITQLMAEEGSAEEEPPWKGDAQVQEVASTTWRLVQALRAAEGRNDSWEVLCNFLFFFSTYLREIIEGTEAPEALVQLDEISSTLSMAAAFRWSHRGIRPRQGRLEFGKRLRDSLARPAPPGPWRRFKRAVNVMTCHASKGLEFTCVSVAGQTFPDFRSTEIALPSQLRADPGDDELQAESLIFVGATRAKRALVVSFAETPSGSPRGRPRRLTKVLSEWLESGRVPVVRWDAGIVRDEEVVVPRVWGGHPTAEMSAYSLSKDVCRLQMYLEEQLGVRFRGGIRPLYPVFISRTRKILNKIAEVAHSGTAMTEEVVDRIVDEEWPDSPSEDHPHLRMYQGISRRWARAFGVAYLPDPAGAGVEGGDVFQWSQPELGGCGVRLHLIEHQIRPSGDRTAIALISSAKESKEGINWSAVKEHQRLPLVLLQERYGDVRPAVFVGALGKLVAFRWHKTKRDAAIAEQSANARAAAAALLQGPLDAQVNDWRCDQCRCRITCPWWMSACPDAPGANSPEPRPAE